MIIKFIQNIKNPKHSELMTMKEITECLKKIKKRRTKDIQGWSNEIMINGGKILQKSLNIIFVVNSEKNLPQEWKDLKLYQ